MRWSDARPLETFEEVSRLLERRDQFSPVLNLRAASIRSGPAGQQGSEAFGGIFRQRAEPAFDLRQRLMHHRAVALRCKLAPDFGQALRLAAIVPLRKRAPGEAEQRAQALEATARVVDCRMGVLPAREAFHRHL